MDYILYSPGRSRYNKPTATQGQHHIFQIWITIVHIWNIWWSPLSQCRTLSPNWRTEPTYQIFISVVHQNQVLSPFSSSTPPNNPPGSSQLLSVTNLLDQFPSDSQVCTMLQQSWVKLFVFYSSSKYLSVQRMFNFHAFLAESSAIASHCQTRPYCIKQTRGYIF